MLILKDVNNSKKNIKSLWTNKNNINWINLVLKLKLYNQ